MQKKLFTAERERREFRRMPLDRRGGITVFKRGRTAEDSRGMLSCQQGRGVSDWDSEQFGGGSAFPVRSRSKVILLKKKRRGILRAALWGEGGGFPIKERLV